MVENKYDKGSSKDDGTNAIGIKLLKFDEVYTNKLNKLNKDIQDNHAKLQEDVEKKINSIRNYIKKNMDDYSVHLDNDLYKKFDVLSKDFKENIDKLKLEYDVKLQDYIVECEVRLNKKYEELTKK
jgi:Skp family chaperone for outer membrane proteins